MFFLKIHPAFPSDANVINPGSNKTLTDKHAAEHSIPSIIGSHTPDNPTPFSFQFHNKFNSWFTSTQPNPGPTPITPITPTFFCFTITSIHGSHPPDPHRATTTFFNFQIASVFGSQPPEPPTDPPPPIFRK